ncbi:L,D-transpeptidase family protein [Novosphingobium sp. KCTC 2891]|uniref:L,D-transpeptidase family protein n=1 Tax=Novosphingobium sp. KCTC 2891 TaxID=2989730 RepID=UPI0022230554|nr:L,D-transpeptidase family protein [Novosphingobium sp. KCTC 2891]MCW1382979.1 L,D-transpeptidase family protein [Novosphingobium sp. KCTC 2891]
MPRPSPFARFRKHPLRATGGFVAISLASMLAFHVGHDAAQLLFGQGQAEAAPAERLAPVPAKAPAAPPVDSPFVVKSVLKIDGPIKFGQFYWDESKAAPGPLVMTVDLEARTLSVFRGGHEIGATAILKGYGDKPTPTGIFPITQKDADHVSSTYEAPMPYMMRLTPDGVSIHGSKVQKGYATNGCVGVPEEFARRLFDVAQLGDKVIITDGKRIGVGDPIIANPDHAS